MSPKFNKELSSLKSSKRASTLDVVETILRRLYRRRKTYLREKNLPGSGKLKKQAATWLVQRLERKNPPYQIRAETIVEIVESGLKTFSSHVDQLIVLRGMAEALDHYFADHWPSLFRERCDSNDVLIVKPLSAFPIIRSEALAAARRKFGKWSVSGNPRTLNDFPQLLDHLGLLTQETHEVRYDFSMWGKDDSVWEDGDLPDYATGLLNHRDEIDWDYCTVNSQRCYIRVEPRGAKASLSRRSANPGNLTDWEAVQLERVKSLISQAAEKQVHVLVLPELCLTRNLQEELASYARKFSYPTVLVLGSAHDCHESGDGTQQKNVLLMLVRGRGFATIYHHKFEPLRVKEHNDSDTDETIELLTDSPHTITILATKRLSVLGLICKDFLVHTTEQVVSQLSPGHILVPAYSEKTAPFQTISSRLAMTNQSIVVVADNGISDRETVRIEGTPVQNIKKFATFAVYAQDPSNAAAPICHEPDWDNGLPALPVLLRLQWATDQDEIPLVIAEPSD